MKKIRGDKLLWQAHTTDQEFFSVSVKVGAVLDYKSKMPVLKQHHFLLPQPSGAIVEREDDQEPKVVERVKMGLGNMVSVKLD